jgi:hypothetical protein
MDTKVERSGENLRILGAVVKNLRILKLIFV